MIPPAVLDIRPVHRRAGGTGERVRRAGRRGVRVVWWVWFGGGGLWQLTRPTFSFKRPTLYFQATRVDGCPFFGCSGFA